MYGIQRPVAVVRLPMSFAWTIAAVWLDSEVSSLPSRTN